MCDNLNILPGIFSHVCTKKKKSKYSLENFDSATERCESFMFSQRGNGESSLQANLVFQEERGLASCLS